MLPLRLSLVASFLILMTTAKMSSQPISWTPHTDLAVTTGATLDLVGKSGTIGALNGSGTVTNTMPATTGTLIIGETNNNGTFTGAIIDEKGAVAVYKVGRGIQAMSGSLTYSGNTLIYTGVWQLGGPNGLSPNSEIGIGPEAILDMGGHHGLTGSLNGPGRVINSGTAPAILTIGNTHVRGLFSGAILDGKLAIIGIKKVGSGTQAISGTNTYSGTTTIAGGALAQSQPNGLSPNSDIAIENGTLLDLAGNSGTIGILSGAGTVTNSLNAAATLSIGRTNHSGIFKGTIQDGNGRLGKGPVVISKMGTGTQAISGNLTYSGHTLIYRGVWQQCGPKGLNPNSDIGVGPEGTLDMGGYSGTTGSLNGSGAITNSGTVQVTLTIGHTHSMGIFLGTIEDGKGVIAIDKVGKGIQGISGTNSYSGTTTITAGAFLQYHSDGFSPKSDIVIANGAILDLAGNSGAIGILTGLGTVTNSMDAEATLSIGNSDNSGTFAGTIVDGNGKFGKGPVALHKVGSGTQTLTGSSSVSGAVAVIVGELVVQGFLQSPTITVADGATLSGTGSIVGNVVRQQPKGKR